MGNFFALQVYQWIGHEILDKIDLKSMQNKVAQLRQGTKQFSNQFVQKKQHIALFMWKLVATATQQVQPRHEYESIKEHNNP